MLNMLAVDLGASSGRVMRAAFNGETLNLEEVRRFRNHPLRISNRLYWNIYSIFQEVKWGLAEVAKIHGDIASFAIDSWAVDFGLLDKSGHLLDLPRHYRDSRNIPAMNAVIERLGHEFLFRRTGIQLNPINSLYQLYAMGQEDEHLLAASDTLLMIPDLLNFLLCGEKAAEFTNATTTQFLSPSGTWDTELLEQLQLPTSMLPKLASPATILGDLRDEELLPIPSLSGVKVVHTTSHDTAAAVVSVPFEEPEFVYISSGTWSLMGTVVDNPVINDLTGRFNFTNEGGLGNYRLLKNVMGLWLVQETQRVLQAIGEPFEIERLVYLAKSATPFTYLFNPDDTRFLQPTNMPETIRQICRETNQNIPDNTGQLVRGIFESLALKYRQVLEELELITDQHYGRIHIVGGGSQNDLLCQFTANATERTVVTGPVEASAMGNVLAQLLALGQIKSTSDMAQLIRQSVQPVSFKPQDSDLWNAAYERFKGISARQAESSMSI